MLTTSVNTFVGTEKGDVFTAHHDGQANVPAHTLSALDELDGGAGKDTLKITSDNAATAYTMAAATIKNIEAITIEGSAAVTAVVSGSNVTGLETISVTKATTANVTAGESTAVSISGITGGATVAGGSTQTVTSVGTAALSGAKGAVNATVTDVTVADGGVTINGGTDITLVATELTAVAAAGTDVAAEIVVGTTVNPTGAIDVTYTGGGYTDGLDDIMNNIEIAGGSTVTVNTTAGITAAQTTTALTDPTNFKITQGAVAVTGGEATTSVTINQQYQAETDYVIGTDGKIGVDAGAVSVKDKNFGTTTAATIATVSLTNAGAVTVDSAALATLNLAGKIGTVNTTLSTPAATGSATLALNTTGANTGAITLDADTKTVNVTNSGTSTVANLTATGATALTVAGSGDLSFTASALINQAGLTSVNVTNTGSTNFGTTQLNNDATFTAAGGSETVKVGATTKAISMGAGNDEVILVSGATALTGSIDAGEGSADRITFEVAADVVTATATNVFEGKISGFEELEIAGVNSANGALVDLGNLDDISKVVLSAINTQDLTLDNMANNGTLRIEASQTNSEDITVIVKNAALSTTDVMNIELSSTTALTTVDVTVANVETINVKTEDTNTTVANLAHALDLNAAAATKIVVTGNAGANLTGSSFSTDLTSFDASAVTAGAVTYTSDALTKASTVKGGAGNDVINMAAATAAVVLSGNAGNDTLTGGTVADTINGGEGNDIIDGKAGADKLTGGAGADVFKFTLATDSNGVNTDTITDFVSGTDKLEITHATLAVTYAGEVSGYGTALTTLSAGTLTAVLDTSTSTLYVDLNNDGALTVADLAIKLDVNDLSQTDFVSLVGGVSTIKGTTGDDIITDTAKADTIQGLAGKDTFVFNSDSGSLAIIDIIQDFTTADDSIKTGVAGTATNFATANGALTFAAANTAADTAFDGTVKYYFASAIADASAIGGSGAGADGAVFIDWDMDGTADQAILIVGGVAGAVVAADFIA